MSDLRTPKPTPKFFQEGQALSTKKARKETGDRRPPRPPIKSPVRWSWTQSARRRPQAVSFNGSEASFHSRLYNEARDELYLYQCFDVESKLGEGSFGVVYQVRSREDGQRYAVKESHARFRGWRDRDQRLEEVAKHEQLPPHPHCLRFVKAWEEDFRLYIQTELCASSLSSYAEKHHDIPEQVVWNYLVDLLQGLKHLHDRDLIHLDLKPDNIFISDDGLCKLGDFGLTVGLRTSDNQKEPIEGDPRYLAPELMQGQFTKAADVFSLGITILELACDLDLPSGGTHWHALRSGTLPREIGSNLSRELRRMIEWMMQPDPQIRPTVDIILAQRSVLKVLRVRRLYVAYRHVINCTKRFFLLLWLALCSWLLVVATWCRSAPGLRRPKRLKKSPSTTFDTLDFSEDEVFENSTISKCSDGIRDRFFDTSSSSNGSHKNDGITPSSSTPKPSPKMKSFRGSLPGPMRSTPWSSSPHNKSASPGRKNRLDDTEWSDIEPRNLLRVFEAAGSSECDS
ncbi:membrane-associated tyrosine- and threonine-specific cdc2-inhibitory kinase-like [Ornithodoros turicata]|uniref:membrane-associated tyrosine- and threonine-specific cdc2-inhibitory kinase-like n=1 Tax=Ornithodoros turicata TaxID=34597 RepID=UPI00313919CF